MNIFSKLIEVRKSVPYLKKDNAGYQFRFVSSSQTLGALRESMDVNRLLLIPRILRHEIRDHTTQKGNHEYFTILDMEFTWVNAENPDETITCPWQGCGLDDGEKGTGKAVTYAEKYFLLKFFNIATDKDDPDSFQKESSKTDMRKTTTRGQEPPNPGTGDPNLDPMLVELDRWLIEMAAGSEPDYLALLLRVSVFKGKNGDVWAKNIRDLAPTNDRKRRWLQKAHHAAKEMYANWSNTDAAATSKKDKDGLFKSPFEEKDLPF